MKRRTREGLERARRQGKALGPPRKFRPNQVETMQRMRDGGASLGGSPQTSSAPPALF